MVAAYDISSPKVTYKLLFSVHEIFMEGWKELVVCFFFCKNRLQSIYTSIVSCVYNLKTHTFFPVICGVSFFIRAMCIV